MRKDRFFFYIPSHTMPANIYDAIIVGGGPAGSMTALSLARKGRSVLQLERAPRFGAVQRCAEGVLQQQLHLYMEPQSRFIRCEINSVRFHAPNGAFIELNRPHSGYILDRMEFDRCLAENAKNAGAEQWLSASPSAFRRISRDRVEMDILCGSEQKKAVAHTLVAADGVESKTARLAGIPTALPLELIGTSYQEIIRHPGIVPNQVAFFVGSAWAPQGYAWVFPRGDGSANMGVVISGSQAQKKRPHVWFEAWLNRFFPDAVREKAVFGAVPGFFENQSLTADNVLLVGDAGRQANPLSFGGILESLRAAVIAAEVMDDACRKNDFSNSFLDHYKKNWNEFLGNKHRKFHKLKKAVDAINDSTFNKALETLSKRDPSHLAIRDIFFALFSSKPSLILELRHLF